MDTLSAFSLDATPIHGHILHSEEPAGLRNWAASFYRSRLLSTTLAKPCQGQNKLFFWIVDVMSPHYFPSMLQPNMLKRAMLQKPTDPRFKDLTDQQFHRLTVLEFAGQSKNRHSLWKCLCECGSVIVVQSTDLTSSKSRSCGCLAKEETVKRNNTHRMSRTRIWNIWCGIKSRCNNRDYHAYQYYGARGILVCLRWDKFENFYADMGEPPPGTSIDRIDNNGPYSPENCRWATRRQQGNNKRGNRLLTYNGETNTLKQWAVKLGMNYYTLHSRIQKLHWSPERAFSR